MKDDFLNQKLAKRKEQQSYRQLRQPQGKTDFCSNDYLGIVYHHLLDEPLSASGNNKPYASGSTGSRLLAGNYSLIEETESFIADFHQAQSGLIFNSGYDANLGLLSSVPQRGDTILFDFLSHASIRDGVRLSFAHSYSFKHNDLDELESLLKKTSGNIFVVTESVFSMDGDFCPLHAMLDICDRYGAHLILDEAHATGVIGQKGEGLAQDLNLHLRCFARIHTFGKALGCHGAIVLGSQELKEYLINFARSFMYTTALPELSVAAIRASYNLFPGMITEREKLHQLIDYFSEQPCSFNRLSSATTVQAIIIPGNERTREVASVLQKAGLDIRPILYPTVPVGSERLRITLHSFNTKKEIELLFQSLSLQPSAMPA